MKGHYVPTIWDSSNEVYLLIPYIYLDESQQSYSFIKLYIM